jgi:hypothetical protein
LNSNFHREGVPNRQVHIPRMNPEGLLLLRASSIL